jgi:hypothetical protein
MHARIKIPDATEIKVANRLILDKLHAAAKSKRWILETSQEPHEAAAFKAVSMHHVEF